MADESAFVFNVPTNVSFTDGFDDENLDGYFDMNNENKPPNEAMFNETSMYFSPSPMFGEENCRNMRRSMSVGNLIMFSENEHRTEENFHLEMIGEHIIHLGINQKSRLDGEKSNENKKNRTMGQSLNNLQALAHNQRKNPEKYVSLAEAVNQFQTRTPVRFHSKPTLDLPPHNSAPLRLTHPQSPALQTKTRTRPNDKIQSTLERELIEFENISNFKLKARPLNKKILQGPIKAQVPLDKRPLTVPQPFNITQVAPKTVEPSPPKYIFHARPAPKMKSQPNRSNGCSAPTSPKPIKKCTRPESRSSTHRQSEKPLEKTIPVPFTFEQRDKMVLMKRAQYIQKIFNEEKRAREFHANPVPKAIYKKTDSFRRNSSSSSTDSSKPSTNLNMDTHSVEFKARPAMVLHKEPFIPAPASKPLTEPVPFHLESERRRQERQQFELQKRQKEERCAMLLKELELKQLELDRQEELRLRKEAVHKAQPIKTFPPMVIKPSGKVTVPVSPKMHRK